MDGFTRREMLAGGAALLTAATAGPAFAAPETGLNAIAAKRGLRFGSTFKWSPPGADAGSFANPDYAKLLTRDCGILVPENEFKWPAIHPAPGTFDFSHFDAMIDWAGSKHLAMRGHTLLWHSARWFPAWLTNYDFGANPAAEGERLLTEHIRTLCRRYGKRIGSYDVVNETIDEKTGELRTTSLSKAIGDPLKTVELAFHTARAEAPHAQLVYNDYMSWEPGNEKHRAAVLKLLEGFRARNVPVDALGIQSHIGVYSDMPASKFAAQQAPEWRRFLDEVVAMGYRILVTEFDVNDKGLPADFTIRDRAVADYSRAYFEVMTSYPQLRDILAWGMSDRYSWLNHLTPRADGKPKRPCPYDDRFQPKPLHTALAEVFAAAPPRG